MRGKPKQRHPNRRAQQDRSGKGKIKGVQNDPTKGGGKVIKEKFQEQRELKHFEILPKTDNQRTMIRHLKQCQIVMAIGASGAGKTYLAVVHAANQLTSGRAKTIVLTRPPEGVGKTIGFRKGTTEEKLEGPYKSMTDPLKMVLGGAHFDYLVKSGVIVLEPLEDVRGRSYRDSVIIVDEASNTDIKSIQTLVTRVGEGSQIIFCGDSASWQKDIKGVSGLDFMVDHIRRLREDSPEWLDSEDYNNLYSNIGITYFTPEDCVRSGITKLLVKSFDRM